MQAVHGALPARHNCQQARWRKDNLERASYRAICRYRRDSLTDGLYGGTTFVESWIGWEGIDGSFVIDLGEEKEFSSVSSDFLHQLGVWILLAGEGGLQHFRQWRRLHPFRREVAA